MNRKCAIFLCVVLVLFVINIKSYADNECANEIVVKNPKGSNRFGAILEPPKGSDYSVWFPFVPRSIAIDSKEDIYIGDSINYRILKFNKEGKYLLQFKLHPAKKQPKPEISHIIQHLGVDSSDNIYVWNYFEERVEIYNSKGQFVKFAAPKSNTIKRFLTKVPTGKLSGYKYEIDSYVQDKKPGELLYKIRIIDRNKKTISECNLSAIAFDDEGLIYTIDKNGYIYTFDYYKTLDVIKINPFRKQ